MAAVNTYTATVVKEDGYWQADVPDLPGAHAFAKTLTNLRHELADAIILSADLDDDTDVTIDFELVDGQDDVMITAFELARARHRLDTEMAALQRWTGEVSAQMVGTGHSVREVAGALDITPGRVSQLAAQPSATARRPVDREYTAAIREWARQAGLAVAERGRADVTAPAVS